MFLHSSCVSRSDVTYTTSHVFSTRTTHVLHHAATQTHTTMEGGERCTFFSWKYSHSFWAVSAKDENIKVCCTLCAGDKVLSSFKNMTSNLELQHSTVKFTEQVPAGGVKQRAVSKATTSPGGPPPPRRSAASQNIFFFPRGEGVCRNEEKSEGHAECLCWGGNGGFNTCWM